MKKRRKNLYVNAIILTITALIMRSVDITFKVYISNNIGAEGMGVYKLITTVTMLATTLAISGISVAVTRIVSEEIGKKSYNNVRYVLLKSCIITSVLSMLICTLTIIFSKYIGVVILKDERTVLAIRVLVISIPFVAISSCIKGYFYAIRDVVIPVTSQIISKFVKIGISVSVLTLLLPMGIKYACVAIVLGTTVSEIIECLYVLIVYKLKDNIKGSKISGDTSNLIGRLVSIAVPIAGSSYISSGLRTVETILIPTQLAKYGMSVKESMSVLGGVMGMVMPIIMFPAALLIAMGTILVPEISRAKAANNEERVNSLVCRAIRFTLLIGIAGFFIFNNFNNQLGVAIYNNSEIGRLFKVFSYIIPIMYIGMVSNSLLKGLNEQVSSLKYNVMDSVLRIILIYFLLPIKGVNGVIITTFISTGFSVILSFNRVMRVTKIKFDLINWVLKPTLAGVTSILIIGLLRRTLKVFQIGVRLDGYGLTIGITTTLAIIATVSIYFAIVGLFDGIESNYLKSNRTK
ncbi:MAG: oligosaccharide flippase family protein [Clostridium sp.]|uniref:oligosaccharide flippase family protein n=1 Tax=Clostridium sp. TaxID=1506 RepID=UPI00303BD9EE